MSDASSSSSEVTGLPVRSDTHKPSSSTHSAKRPRLSDDDEDDGVVDRKPISKRGARGRRGGGIAPEVARMLKQAEETHAMEPREFFKYLEKQHKRPYSKEDKEYEKHVNETEPYTQRLWPVMRRMPDMNFVVTPPLASYHSHNRSDNQRGDRGDNQRGDRGDNRGRGRGARRGMPRGEYGNRSRGRC